MLYMRRFLPDLGVLAICAATVTAALAAGAGVVAVLAGAAALVTLGVTLTRLALSRRAPVRATAVLFTTAVEQLRSEYPPIRMGALHTLERIGQEYPDRRQSIVDIVCTYLRTPFDRTPRSQEAPVRAAAQRILTRHFRPDLASYWSDLALDLTSATLVDFELSGCHIGGAARFDAVTFEGQTCLRGATFAGEASFAGAVFTGHAWFERSSFLAGVRLDAANFRGDAWLGEVELAGRANLRAVTFAGHAWFGGLRASGPVDLSESVFRRSAGFRGARFAAGAVMTGTVFAGPARVSRLDDGWNLCPLGWRVEPDPDNRAVGHLHWAGSPALAEHAADLTPL